MKKYLAIGLVFLALVFWGARHFLLSQNQTQVVPEKKPIELVASTETLINNGDVFLLDTNEILIQLTETADINEYEAKLSDDNLTVIISGKEQEEHKIWTYEDKKKELVALSENMLKDAKISPEKNKIAYLEIDENTEELYIYDRETKTSQRLSSDAQEIGWISEHQLVFRDSEDNLIYTENETQTTIATNVSSFFISDKKLQILSLHNGTWQIRVINMRGKELQPVFDLEWEEQYKPYNLTQIDDSTYLVRRLDSNTAKLHEIWEIDLSHQEKKIWNQNAENFSPLLEGKKLVERNQSSILLSRTGEILKEFENFTIAHDQNQAKDGNENEILLQKSIDDLSLNGISEQFTLQYNTEKSVFTWSIAENGNAYYEEIAYFYPLETKILADPLTVQTIILLEFQNPNHNHQIIWNGKTVEKKLEPKK